MVLKDQIQVPMLARQEFTEPKYLCNFFKSFISTFFFW